MVNTMRARIVHISDRAVQSTLVTALSGPSFPHRRVTITTTYEPERALACKSFKVVIRTKSRQFATEATGIGEGSLKSGTAQHKGNPCHYLVHRSIDVCSSSSPGIFMHTWPAPGFEVA